MALVAKNLPAMQETQETQVLSLGRKDLLEKGMATHSSILAWRIPWIEEPGKLQSMAFVRFKKSAEHLGSWAKSKSWEINLQLYR